MRILSKIGCVNGLGSYQLVVSFFYNLHASFNYRQFEHRDTFVRHELSRDATANETWKSLGTKRNILLGLYYAMLVRTTLCLHRDHELAPVLVQSHVDFIYLNLTDTLHCGPEVILKRVGRNTEKYIDQSVVSNFRQ